MISVNIHDDPIFLMIHQKVTKIDLKVGSKGEPRPKGYPALHPKEMAKERKRTTHEVQSSFSLVSNAR